ncbi:MAG: sulfatase [Rhodothermales bacterium]
MTRSLILLLLFVLAGCTEPPPAPEPLPNIVFFLTDDQRFDMMGNMSPWLHTPTMDRMAEEGVRFENAFVTTSICAASRASILTGLVERTHGFTFLTPPLAQSFSDMAYPKLMREGGYHTGFVGKLGVWMQDSLATDTWFDTFVPLNRTPYFKPQPDGTERHLTDLTADHAIDYIEARSPDQPFMLSVSFNAPHAEDNDERQYLWPVAFDTFYQSLDVPEPPLAEPPFFDDLPRSLRDPEVNMNRYRWLWRFDTPEKAEAMTKGYYRMISGVDAAMGRVWAALEAQDLADNTILVLMGDNGYFLGERGYAGKWLPHEPSIRVPLVIYDPRHPEQAGRRPEAFALNIDLPSTFLDWAGLPIPDAMQGRSLRPLLAGASPDDWRNDFWIEHRMPHPQIVEHEGVRTERYKYTRYLPHQHETLFDLEADPLETQNLTASPEHAAMLSALRAHTDSLRAAYAPPSI